MPKVKSTRKRKAGGNEQQKHMDEKRIMDKQKREQNKKAIAEMQIEGKYLEPEQEGPQSYFAVDGIEIDPKTREEMVRTGNTTYTDVTKMQRQLFDDPMVYEFMEQDGLTFGGKKRKTNKRRKSNKNKRKKTKRRYKKRK